MSIFKKRGDYQTINEFLSQRAAALAPAINPISGVKEAMEILRNELYAGTPVWIIGDYDVDGIMAAAICYKGIMKFLFEMGLTCEVHTRLPHRITEGYGLSEKIVAEIPDGACIITIDNGIAAAAAISKAKERGMTVIVTDHHLAPTGILPEADILIDPNAIAEQCDFTGFCGAGLALKMMIELLGDIDCEELYALASLATIADVVPINNENYVIASFLETAVEKNRGLRKLAMLYDISEFDEKDAGFKVCPAINAVGRLNDAGAEEALALILSEDEDEIEALAKRLYEQNEIRKEMTVQAVVQAKEFIAATGVTNPLVVVGEYHEGIVGIVAGRLAEEYHVPAYVFTKTPTVIDGETVYKGSARTYGENNVKEILDGCKELLWKYGGHKAAAGVSIFEKNLDGFREQAQKFAMTTDDADVVYYDLEIKRECKRLGELLEKAYDEVKICAPYGENNPEPVFLIRGIQIAPKKGQTYTLMGSAQQHIKLFSKDIELLGFDLSAKFFEMGEPDMIDVVGSITANHFNNEIIYQFEMLDFTESN